jgi:hypothetical protein
MHASIFLYYSKTYQLRGVETPPERPLRREYVCGCVFRHPARLRGRQQRKLVKQAHYCLQHRPLDLTEVDCQKTSMRGECD